jgi:hypothetical protein
MKYVVIYRTGGLANYEYHHVLELYSTMEEAWNKKLLLANAGYPGYVEIVPNFDAIIYPDRFDFYQWMSEGSNLS